MWGCSAAGPGKAISIQYKGERMLSDKVNQFVYNYWVEDGEPKEINVYATREETEYIITVGNSTGNMMNEFRYSISTVSKVNFINEYMNLEETVNSLREATDRSVTYFLQNTVE